MGRPLPQTQRRGSGQDEHHHDAGSETRPDPKPHSGTDRVHCVNRGAIISAHLIRSRIPGHPQKGCPGYVTTTISRVFGQFCTQIRSDAAPSSFSSATFGKTTVEKTGADHGANPISKETRQENQSTTTTPLTLTANSQPTQDDAKSQANVIIESETKATQRKIKSPSVKVSCRLPNGCI